MTAKPSPIEISAGIILRGICAHRTLADAGSVSAEEYARLEQGARDRNDAKEELRHFSTLAEHFGWPGRLAHETRGEFFERRTAELDAAVERVRLARLALQAPPTEA